MKFKAITKGIEIFIKYFNVCIYKQYPFFAPKNLKRASNPLQIVKIISQKVDNYFDKQNNYLLSHLKIYKMARISEYQGANSTKSEAVISRLLSKISLNASEIEVFQSRYNISNLELARLSCHAMSQLTAWKSGVEIPKRVQIQFALLFTEFKKEFGE